MNNKTKSKKRLFFASIIAMLIILIGFLGFNQVDNTLSDEDIYYIAKIMREHQVKLLRDSASYEEQVKFIQEVQQAVLATAPKNKGLPEGMLREPKQLVQAKVGLCYDRSRVIEKILRYNNLNTRHIAAYSLKEVTSPMKAIFSSGVESHALSEVETKFGWMFVDSNACFIGMNSTGQPVSMGNLQDVGFENIKWNKYNDLSYKVIYKNNFTFLYGLYSRHGRFYPPFNFVPDINWVEFFQNI